MFAFKRDTDMTRIPDSVPRDVSDHIYELLAGDGTFQLGTYGQQVFPKKVYSIMREKKMNPTKDNIKEAYEMAKRCCEERR
jgi:hypothetical protein